MFHRISITHVQLLNLKQLLNNCNGLKRLHGCVYIRSRVAQWKRAGPITQRSEDRNLALLHFIFLCFCVHVCLLALLDFVLPLCEMSYDNLHTHKYFVE